MSKQLEEAEAIIASLTSPFRSWEDAQRKADEYIAKYHSKDELFEKFDKILYQCCSILAKDKRKQIFEELKKDGAFTMALDEAIKWLSSRDLPTHEIYTKLQEIRTKYSTEVE